jgi:hypothetical protein
MPIAGNTIDFRIRRTANVTPHTTVDAVRTVPMMTERLAEGHVSGALSWTSPMWLYE